MAAKNTSYIVTLILVRPVNMTASLMQLKDKGKTNLKGFEESDNGDNDSDVDCWQWWQWGSRWKAILNDIKNT